MATLYRKADGQLVIDTVLPPGGSVVTLSPTNNRSDLIPWYRSIDTTNLTEWHAAKYSTAVNEVSKAGANQATGNISLGTSTTGNTDDSYGNDNIALGKNALSTPDVTKLNNIGIGTNALKDTISSSNIAIGAGALMFNDAGFENIAIGTDTLNTMTGSFSGNIAIGGSAGFSVAGNNNIFLGYNAGTSVLAGNGNVYIGGAFDPAGATTNNNLFFSDGAGTLRLRYSSLANSWWTSAALLITDAAGGLGYTGSAVGTVTQLTSKTTSVTLNALAGTIITDNSTLAANATATFTFINSCISAADNILLARDSAANYAAYSLDVTNIGAGACFITIRNLTAVAVADSFKIRFTIFKCA